MPFKRALSSHNTRHSLVQQLEQHERGVDQQETLAMQLQPSWALGVAVA